MFDRSGDTATTSGGGLYTTLPGSQQYTAGTAAIEYMDLHDYVISTMVA
jgi:hypothetical protein